MRQQESFSPYYAVIFTTIRTERENGYSEMAAQMEELAAQQPGYLGIESIRNETSREGITVSYWKDAESKAMEGECGASAGSRAWQREMVCYL
jgi:antibiotic biosynthesis monooxygenase (ABM) superfamily enzyme